MCAYIRHYFASANTAKGFQNMFGSNLQKIGKVYILKGGPGNGKSTLMKKIGEYFYNKNFDVEYIHCSSDPDSLDGVIIRKLSVAMVDGTSPHVLEPFCPGCIEQYINLGRAWNIEGLKSYQREIMELFKNISSCYTKVYSLLADAMEVHDEWEKIYIKNMNFEKANDLYQSITEKIIGDKKLNKEGTTYHRFFGASTYKGPVNYVETIIGLCSKKYYIKGRPGTGKSSMMKKIAVKAKINGFDAEIYHCSFDPNSLDMVLLPELDCVIFDSTAPHEFDPDSNTDTLIDMYEELILPGTDERFEKEIQQIKEKYQNIIGESTGYLKTAKQLHDELETYYIRETDFNVIEEITNSILLDIDKLENR